MNRSRATSVRQSVYKKIVKRLSEFGAEEGHYVVRVDDSMRIVSERDRACAGRARKY